MRSTMRTTVVAVAAALGYSASGHAAMTVADPQVVNVTNWGVSTWAGYGSPFVSVRGIAYDPVADIAGGSIKVQFRNQDVPNGPTYEATASERVDALLDVLTLKATGSFPDPDTSNGSTYPGLPSTTFSGLSPSESTAVQMSRAGYIATFTKAGLAQGFYVITGIKVDGQLIPVNNGSTFMITDDCSCTVDALAKPANGAVEGYWYTIGLGNAQDTAHLNYMKPTIYPRIPSGDYLLSVPKLDAFGRTRGASVDTPFTYARPKLVVDAKQPDVENFPGAPKVIQLRNPLTNELLSGYVSGTARSQEGGRVNDYDVPPSDPNDPYSYGWFYAQGSGTGSDFPIRATSNSASATFTLELDAADAPDVVLTVGKYSLAGAMAVRATGDSSTFTPGETLTLTGAAVTESPQRCTIVPFGVNSSGQPTTDNADFSAPQCAIKWTDTPAGFTQNSGGRNAILRGTPMTNADLHISYETGVLFKPLDGDLTFYKATSETATFAGGGAPTMTIAFQSLDALARAKSAASVVDPNAFFVTTGARQQAGTIIVNANRPGITVKTQWDGEATVSNPSNQRSLRIPIYATTTAVGQTRSLTVTSYGADLTSPLSTKTITFTALPSQMQLALLRPAIPVSTDPLSISGKFGRIDRSRNYTFSPATMGEWSIALTTVARNGVAARTLGTTTTAINTDGTFTVPVGQLQPGTFEVVATATLVNPISGYTAQIRAGGLWLTVRDGGDLPIKLTAQPTSGPLPFTPALSAVFTSAIRASDMSSVRWEKWEGGAWSTVNRIDGSAESKAVLRPTFTSSGSHRYRAVMVNRWTNQPTTTNEVEVVAFVRPAVSIVGPNAGFTGQPVTMTVNTDLPEDQAVLNWTVSRGVSDATPIRGTGRTIAFTPNSPASYIVSVAASQLGAPSDNVGRLRTASVNFAAVLPKLQPASITGERSPEVGKAYVYRASSSSPFAPGATTQWIIKAKWALPDGSEQPDGPLTFQFEDGSTQQLKYTAWIEGIPGSEVTTALTVSPWSYVWPNWHIATRVLDTTAPARVQLQLVPSETRALAGLHGETLTYSWNIPTAATTLDKRGENAFISLPQGTWTITGNVSDSRGHVANVTTAPIVVGAPSELAFNIEASAGQDRFMRAPLTMGVTVRVTSLPRGDSFESATFSLDGKTIGTITTPFGTLNVPNAGTHTLEVVVRSRNGQAVSKSIDIVATEGDPPVCSIAVSGATAPTLTASCAVQLGFVAGYEWYLNTATGSQKVGAARSLSIGPADLLRTQSVTLKALTDKGRSSTWTWIKP